MYKYKVKHYTMEMRRSGSPLQDWMDNLGGKVVYMDRNVDGTWLACVETESDADRRPEADEPVKSTQEAEADAAKG